MEKSTQLHAPGQMDELPKRSMSTVEQGGERENTALWCFLLLWLHTFIPGFSPMYSGILSPPWMLLFCLTSTGKDPVMWPSLHTHHMNPSRPTISSPVSIPCASV